MNQSAPLLSLRNIGKTFPGTIALDGVGFELLGGEVHVLLGENGAGKSTLIKILSGVHALTSGDMFLQGMPLRELTPAIARARGIRVIYQELSLIDPLSVLENLFVGELPVRRRFGISIVDRAMMREQARKLLNDVGLTCPLEIRAGELSVAEKQQLEIAKALRGELKILILDEPTSSLSPVETDKLFALLSRLRRRGVGIVYITHRLAEIKAIGDRVTVLTDGRSMGTYAVSALEAPDLIALMVGREVDLSGRRKGALGNSQVKLEVRDLSTRDGSVRNVSFRAHRGEILGFAGLVGSGRSALMEAIFGLREKSGGEVRIDGGAVVIGDPNQALRAGLGFATEDRARTGFFPNFSVAENISIAAENRKGKNRFPLSLVRGGPRDDLARVFSRKLDIRCASIEQKLIQLSGGNQQKAIIAKWLAAECEILIFDEPTRGIDVGSRAEIYTLLRGLADAGKCILLVSSDLPEILLLADRIAVYCDGTIAGFVASNSDSNSDPGEATEQHIMSLAIGATARTA